MEVCAECRGIGVVPEIRNGRLCSKKCRCVGKFGNQYEIELIEKKIEIFNKAKLECVIVPPRFADLPKEIMFWLREVKTKPRSLFISGLPGSGKTTLAAWAAFHYIATNGDAEEILNLQSFHFFNSRREAVTASFADPNTENNKYRYKWFQSVLAGQNLLILDKVGEQPGNENTHFCYSEFLSLRAMSRMPTIYVSNYSKLSGLNKKNLIHKIGGAAAEVVLDSVLCHIDGGSKRKPIVDDCPVPEKQEVTKETLEEEWIENVPEEEKKNFTTTGIALGETSSPCFVGQNPIFQLVSDQDRKKYTDENGKDIQLPVRDYSDAWQKGDELSINGFMLCQNDLMVFLALLEILHDRHRLGQKGLGYQTTMTEVRNKLGIKSRHSSMILYKSMQRLAKTRIQYKNANNRGGFVGGFIEFVKYNPHAKGSDLVVSINPSLIKFYNTPDYFKLKLQNITDLSYQTKLLYTFIESQKGNVVQISLEQLAKLYGKDVAYAKNRMFKKRLKEDLDVLIEKKLIKEDSFMDKNGYLTIYRIQVEVLEQPALLA